MANRRRYEVIYVSNLVNCSSSGHLHVGVDVTDLKTRHLVKGVSYFIGGDVGKWRKNYLAKLPSYLTEDTEKRLLEMWKAGKLVVFEYTRDGDRRFDDLRYFHQGSLDELMRRFEGRNPTQNKIELSDVG